MSKESTLKGSQTDWEALEKMEDEDIDLSEIPEVTAEQITQATLRVGGKQGQTAEDIVQTYPHLSHSQVYVALAYYHENQAQIDAELAEMDADFERLKHENQNRDKS